MILQVNLRERLSGNNIMSEDEGIFREVDEAVRNEKFQQLWDAVGQYIIWLTIGLIALTIAYVFWNNYVESKQEAMTDSLYEAVKLAEAGNNTQALEIIKTLNTSGSVSFETLSKIWLVKLTYAMGNETKATELAREFSKDSDMPKPYREWFHIYLTGDASHNHNADSNSFYYFTEIEQQALTLIEEKKLQEASALYDQIANDAQAPTTMRQRASTILKNYLPEPLSKTNVKVDVSAE